MKIYDEEEIFIYANPAAEKIFGMDKGDLIGLCVNDFLVGENIDKVKNETRKRLQNKSSSFEHEIVLKDGIKKNILATATPRFDDDKFIGTFAIFHDITERKKAEEALKKKSQEINSLNSHFLGRELKMIDLKVEINEMLINSGGEEKYVIHRKTE